MQGTLVGRIHSALGRRPILAISTPVFVALAVQAVTKVPSEWNTVLVAAARAFVNGGDIYRVNGYPYPPFMGLLLVPFVPLPDLASRLVYFAANVAGIVGLLRAAWQVSGGRKLSPVGPDTRREWSIAALGVIAGGPFILSALAHTQVDVFIDFFAVAGCLLLLRGRTLGGAALIGLAAAFKGPPLLFAAYLAFRRSFGAAAVVVLVAVGLNLLPDLIVPPASGEPRLQVWLQHYVFNTLGGPLGSWDGMSIFNQSLAGTLQRLATSTLDFTPEEITYLPSTRVASELVLKLAAYAAMGVLLIAAVVAALRGQAVAGPQQSGAKQGAPPKGELPSLTALELAAVSTLMLLLSPMSHLTHLAVLVLPAFCLARIAVMSGDRIAAATLAVAVLSGIAANKDLIGGFAYTIYLWSGVPTLGMLMLLAGCLLAMARGECGPPVATLARSIMPSSLRRERVPA
jgi:hypothetical protein